MLCLYNMHQFDTVVKVVIFGNSLPLPERRFYRNRGPARRVESPSETRTICVART